MQGKSNKVEGVRSASASLHDIQAGAEAIKGLVENCKGESEEYRLACEILASIAREVGNVQDFLRGVSTRIQFAQEDLPGDKIVLDNASQSD